MLEFIGWYGVVAIVGAYALNSFDLIESNSISYQLLNLSGAIGVLSISFVKQAYQPAILNIIWAFIALVALLKIIF